MSTPTQSHSPTSTGTTDDRQREDAGEYVQQLRVFYIHAAVAAVGMVAILVVNLAVNLAADLTTEW